MRNYAVSNGDAHLKNVSLIESGSGDYLLSPAYDLVCTSMHFPEESRTALALFDTFESEGFQKNGFYGREDFRMLAKIYGMNMPRAERMLDSFTRKAGHVRDLVARAFLSDAAKRDYLDRFADRMKAMA